MGEAATVFLRSVGFVAPELLVCLVALVLALAFKGRARVPCLLAVAGSGVLVAATLGVAAAEASLVASVRAGEGNPAEYLRASTRIAVAGTCARAVGLGLLVAGIFVGRRAGGGGPAEPGAPADPRRGSWFGVGSSHGGGGC